jgi:BMFP domain-containing protein YqiC
MIDKSLFEDLYARINQALRDSPAADFEKNVKAILGAWFDRLELVQREDFDVQRKLLERAQQKLADLENRLAELERKASGR